MSEARKDDGGKLRYDLFPAGPLAELARVFTIGAGRYGDRNWELGLDYGRVFAAMQRHAWAWHGGEQHDPDDGQHHLASVAWCALALIELEQTHPERDDRPLPTTEDLQGRQDRLREEQKRVADLIFDRLAAARRLAAR